MTRVEPLTGKGRRRAHRIRSLQPEDGAEWHRLCSGQLAFYMTSVVEDVHTSTFARLQGDDPEACRLCDRIAKVTPFIQHSRL